MSSSLTAKSKKGTVIHRTTSETLRLGDDALNNHNQIRVSVQTTSSRKKSQTTSPSCSFQITGVSLTRCDIGDDSADDLDESHTDDISRITDNETPSFSEDSRDTDDQVQQNSYNSAITVPQQQPATKVEPETKWKEKETRDLGLGRFKVVKIESVVPFSRGRWTCFDYLDQSETSSKPSYVFCKKLGNGHPEVLDSVKPRVCTGNSFVNSNNYTDMEEQKRNPSTPVFWETNCQESYLYSGAIIMPDTTSLFPVSRPPKSKIRSTCPTTPNIPMVRPIRSARPFFTTCPSFDSVIKTTQYDRNILINTCPIKNEADINNQENICKEVVTQDLNKNAGASVSCTATIDTKIEHALDVVKNHLTHAVRLEVEELKIKINELVDRISYLEYENDLLRANVAPEVLASLGNPVGK